MIPDPEAAHIVTKIFEMYVRGDRMCDILAWLRDNKVPTVGTLLYRRTGDKRHYRGESTEYIWPDKTIFDILVRQEYLGHTITNKTKKASYKLNKKIVNPEEERLFFPNTHEPLVDEETFALAQKRLATRTRPTKIDEIDMYSGLLFCGECGAKMYVRRGSGTLERKHGYTCGHYRSYNRMENPCTSHMIRKTVLNEIVLNDLQRVMSYIKKHEKKFISMATEQNEQAIKKSLAQQRKQLEKAEKRLSDLDLLFRKTYEDNALGKITYEQFSFLASGYDEEKKTLKTSIAELKKTINSAMERNTDVNKFVALVRKYTEITELNYEILHEFIDHILIHELDRETYTREIEIFYTFVGKIDTGDEPIENITHIRQERADVTTLVV